MDIKNELQSVFRDVFDDEGIEIYETMTAQDIEEWDSLTHIQLIAATEKQFNMRFKTAEIADLKNVGEMIQLIAKKKQA